MKYATLLLVSAAVLSVPGVVEAATSNFARDRNISVGERIPRDYVPLGIRAGVFDVAPRLDLGLATNSNVLYRDSARVSDVVFNVAPSVAAKSTWSRHSVTASVGADFDSYSKTSSLNTADWNAALGARLDIHGNSYAFGGFSISKNHEPLFNPARPQSAAEPVEFGATQFEGGVVAEGNRLRFTGTVNSTKLDYKDVRSIAGGRLDQDGRDFTKTSATGRADYAVSPDTSAYFLYSSNKRDYKSSASIRDSDGYDVAIGSSFDLTNLVRGEVQIGYLEQNYKSPTLKKTSGSSIKAKVEYFPTQLLTVNFTTGRTVEETPEVLAAGYLSTVTAVGADYELLRNLVLSASVRAIDDNYSGIDRKDARKSFNLGGKYLVSRNVSLNAGYLYSENKSSGSAKISSYKDHVFRIGVGLQY